MSAKSFVLDFECLPLPTHKQTREQAVCYRMNATERILHIRRYVSKEIT